MSNLSESQHTSTLLFENTIVAIATPPGDGAVGIVRLSGPQSWQIAERLFTPVQKTPSAKTLTPWQIAYGTFHELDQPNKPLDDVLVLPFRSPKSFTGEDVIEFQVHGGQALTETVLRLCIEAGAEPAQAGEFTQRAFLNGRLDLSQAESVLDLIQAQGRGLMEAASKNVQTGALRQAIDLMCEELIDIQAQITASVDFPDEVDEPERAPLIQQLNALQHRVDALQATSKQYRWLKHGVTIALVGQPNAGKSSLFNTLLSHERAIVTDIAGTTRDTITETLTLSGVPVTLVDTAGLRDTDDPIEQLGVERSREAVQQADMVLYMYNVALGWTPEDDALFDDLQILNPNGKDTKCLGNHLDTWQGLHEKSQLPLPKEHTFISAKSGEGISDLVTMLTNMVKEQLNQASEVNNESKALSHNDSYTQCLVNERQQRCLQEAHQHLGQAMRDLSEPTLPIDLVTVPLSDGLRSIGQVTGRDTTEDLLTDIFSRFCVGK